MREPCANEVFVDTNGLKPGDKVYVLIDGVQAEISGFMQYLSLETQTGGAVYPPCEGTHTVSAVLNGVEIGSRTYSDVPPTQTPTETPSETPTQTPSQSPTPTPTPTETPSPSPTPSDTPSPTPTGTSTTSSPSSTQSTQAPQGPQKPKPGERSTEARWPRQSRTGGDTGALGALGLVGGLVAAGLGATALARRKK